MIRELKQAKNGLIQEMRALLAKAESESRDLSDDEKTRFETLKAEDARLDEQIQRQEYLADSEKRMQAVQGVGADSFEQRAADFQITRAIAARLQPGIDDGLERELSQELARRSHKTPQGILVPHEVFRERRAVTAGGSGANLVPDPHRADLYIDLLRDSLLMKRLGAVILDGLVGNVDIPKLTTGGTTYWVAESGDITAADHVFDTVGLEPKTVGCLVEYSRRMLINAVPSVEQLVRRDFAQQIAAEIDNQTLIGDGASNRPTGIKNDGSVNSVSFAGAPTWAAVLEFIALVSEDSALQGSLNWVGNPWASKEMMETTKETDDAAGGYIQETPTMLAGYPYYNSNALDGDPNSSPVEAADLIFGDFSQVLIGYWSGVDILVNPFHSDVFKAGDVYIIALQDVDTDRRHSESFAVATDMTVS